MRKKVCSLRENEVIPQLRRRQERPKDFKNGADCPYGRHVHSGAESQENSAYPLACSCYFYPADAATEKIGVCSVGII